jgi:hypothetical protein
MNLFIFRSVTLLLGMQYPNETQLIVDIASKMSFGLVMTIWTLSQTKKIEVYLYTRDTAARPVVSLIGWYSLEAEFEGTRVEMAWRLR